ncbi:hypothetical protein MRX96_019046 [Rhipicephalus microplus]
MAAKISSIKKPPTYFPQNRPSDRHKYQGKQDEYESIQFEPGCSIGMPSAENPTIPHRKLLRSSPEDLAIQYRKRMKSNTDATHSICSSMKKETSPNPEVHWN